MNIEHGSRRFYEPRTKRRVRFITAPQTANATTTRTIDKYRGGRKKMKKGGDRVCGGLVGCLIRV